DDSVSIPYTSSIKIHVLNNDIDTFQMGMTLVAGSVTPPNPPLGTVTPQSDNTILFTPTIIGPGVCTFTYQMKDGSHISNVATVTVNILPAPENTIFLFQPADGSVIQRISGGPNSTIAAAISNYANTKDVAFILDGTKLAGPARNNGG